MFEGNRFFPLTGTPILKMERMRTLLEDWLPEPLIVATWIEKSLTTASGWPCCSRFSRTSASVDILALPTLTLATLAQQAMISNHLGLLKAQNG